jgi:Uma2 family endonuclease
MTTHGVPLVWVVSPEDQVVNVHRPGHAVEGKTDVDLLTVYQVLPDLLIPVAEIFRTSTENPIPGS